MSKAKLSVIGAGAWGTALANLLAEEGAVLLWAREAEVVNEINDLRENKHFLPGIELSGAIEATGDMAAACDSEMILLVAPAQHLRAVSGSMSPHVAPGTPVVICAKGIERDSHKLMSEVLSETLADAVPAVLSGPTFAHEVARHLPTAVTLACRDQDCGEALVEAVGRPHFRPYYTSDVVGAQIGGAVKNVLAIASGIVEGKRLGENARAAMIARAIAEIVPLGEAMGGSRETLMGLSGIGDLILTCTSGESRNYSLGRMLGEGRGLEDILAERAAVTEGVHTAGAVAALAREYGLDLPICLGVDAILNQGQPIETVIEDLLHRPFTDERTGETLEHDEA